MVGFFHYGGRLSRSRAPTTISGREDASILPLSPCCTGEQESGGGKADREKDFECAGMLVRIGAEERLDPVGTP